jgi:hypothetical protein
MTIMTRPKIYTWTFANIYPLYLQKAKGKGRTKAEVDQVIFWLTGHTAKSLQKAIDAEIDLEAFVAKAPRFQRNANLITGVVCGIRVEEIEDETTRKIRYMDKLIDELAKGKAMEKILRKRSSARPYAVASARRRTSKPQIPHAASNNVPGSGTRVGGATTVAVKLTV